MNDSINNTPDLHSSSKQYATRFSGEIGKHLLDVQETALFKLLDRYQELFRNNPNDANDKISTPPISICDIGGGHGQIAIPILKNEKLKDKATITVYGSNEEAFENLNSILFSSSSTTTTTTTTTTSSSSLDSLSEQQQQQQQQQHHHHQSIQPNLSPNYKTGSLVNFELQDKEFNIATCFRIISHIEDPKKLIAELCRVAKDAVIIDYASIYSVNLLSTLLFPIKKLVEKNTRQFHTFTPREIYNEFQKHGFKIVAEEPQFFFPMALYRAVKSRAVAAVLEKVARGVGASRVLGSPRVLIGIRR